MNAKFLGINFKTRNIQNYKQFNILYTNVISIYILNSNNKQTQRTNWKCELLFENNVCEKPRENSRVQWPRNLSEPFFTINFRIVLRTKKGKQTLT